MTSDNTFGPKIVCPRGNNPEAFTLCIQQVNTQKGEPGLNIDLAPGGDFKRKTPFQLDAGESAEFLAVLYKRLVSHSFGYHGENKNKFLNCNWSSRDSDQDNLCLNIMIGNKRAGLFILAPSELLKAKLFVAGYLCKVFNIPSPSELIKLTHGHYASKDKAKKGGGQ